MKTTYNDIFVRMSVLVAIPATVGERSLKPSTSTSLVLLRAQHSRKIEEFEDTVRKGLEELKKQERFKDFDELAAKAHEPAKDGEAPRKPEGFDELEAALPDEYRALRAKASMTETSFEFTPLSRAELEDIVDTVGMEGDIELPHGREPRAQFLSTVAALFAM